MKLFITGFKPFGDIQYNPSEWLAKNFHAKEIAQFQIQSQVLDVVYQTSESELAHILQHHQPDYLLMLGVAANRENLCLEKIAKNFRGHRQDNTGSYPVSELINQTGSLNLETNLNLDRIINLYKGPISLEISFDAGDYLCNQVLYQSLTLKEMYQLKTKIGFLHVPYREEKNIKDLKDSVEQIIKLII